MTSHGRGRGFRRNPEAEKPVGIVRSQEGEGGRKRDDEEARSRDSPLPPIHCSLEGLMQLIEAGQDMRKITKCIKLLCNTDESLRFVIEEIHSRSLASESFGKNAAKALSNVSQLEVSGIKLRDVVLRCIQSDFKRRQDIRDQDELLYLRAVSLLCEIFHRLRLADGTVINVLSVPILEYFNSLLSSPCQSAAFELLSTQTQAIGEEVQRCKPDKFADFLLKIRKLIIEPDSGLTLHSRCVLLHILESHLLRWPSALPEKSGEFYASILGQRIHSRLPALAKSKECPEEDQAGHHRPSSTSPPVPRVFNTPPPNMLPQQQQHFRAAAHQPPPPPPLAGRYPNSHVSPPPPQQQLGAWGHQQDQAALAAAPARFNYQPEFRDSSSIGSVGYPDHPPLNGVERIAADMMAMRLPPQQQAGSSHHLQGRPGGPASHLQPQQQRPPAGGWQAMPPILPPTGTSPNIPTAIVPPGVPPHGRTCSDVVLGGGGYETASHGRMMEQRHGGNWGGAASGPSEGGGYGNRSGESRTYGGHQQQQQPEGPAGFSNSGRTGGSGRIIPNSSAGERGGGWGSSNTAAGPDLTKELASSSSSSSWARREPQQQQQQFDIGTWENPGGGNDSTATTATTADAADSGWSTADTDTNKSSWSTAGGPGWSTGGDAVKDAAPSTSSWGTDEIGHWGGGANEVPTPKTGGGGGDWRNDSAGSVELSPGSQWKKEAGNLSNWADAVPSPRSDQEDNPLNASIETVARKIVW